MELEYILQSTEYRAKTSTYHSVRGRASAKAETSSQRATGVAGSGFFKQDQTKVSAAPPRLVMVTEDRKLSEQIYRAKLCG